MYFLADSVEQPARPRHALITKTLTGQLSSCAFKQQVNLYLTNRQSQLTQEPDIVLKQQADIGDSVLAHGEAFYAETEGKAGPFFGVYAAGGEDGGVDHAATAQFHPADGLIGAQADFHIHFCARLGEGEETRAKTNLGIWPKVSAGEV